MKYIIVIILLCAGVSCYASSTDVLKDLIKQDKAVYKICKKQACDADFSRFYFNLLDEVGKISNAKDLDERCNRNYECTLYPKTKLVYYSYTDWTGIDINHAYLYNRYCKYLGKDWQAYLETQKDNMFMNLGFGVYYSNEQINKQKQIWKQFIDKYPNFPLNNYIKQCIKDIDIFLN